LGRFKFTHILLMLVMARQSSVFHVGIGYAKNNINYAKTAVVLN
jgi:hypothetical protein